MLSISKCRKELGDVAKNFSDEEVKKVRDTQYQLAEIIFDKWLEDRKPNKIHKNNL